MVVGLGSAVRAELLADLAVRVLVEEAELTPKPALVDRRGGGAHQDMNLEMFRRSAHALRPTFEALATRAHLCVPSRRLREELAAIGRRGEEAMFAVTGGVNTHRGAIWALGLLTAAAAMAPPEASPTDVAALAGRVAAFPDRYAPTEASHGSLAAMRYGVAGARGEARQGFPHVVGVALPTLRGARPPGLARRPHRPCRRHLFTAPRWPLGLAGRPKRSPSGARRWRYCHRGGPSRAAVAGGGDASVQRRAWR